MGFLSGINDLVSEVIAKIVSWVLEGTVGVMAWLYTYLLKTTTPTLDAEFVSLWAGRMFTVGIATAVLFLIFQIGQTVITGGRNRMSAFDLLLGFVAFMIITPSILGLISLLQAGIDSVNIWLVGLVKQDMLELPDQLNELATQIPTAFTQSGLSVFFIIATLIGSVIAGLGGFLLWILLIIREYLVYLLVIMAPVVLSGLTWRVTATWVKKWLPILVSLLLTPVFVTVIFGLSNSMMAEALKNLNDWLTLLSEVASEGDPGKIARPAGASPAPEGFDPNDPGKIMSFFVMSGGSFFIALFAPWVLYKVMTEWLNMRDQAIGLEQAAGSKVMSTGKDLSRKVLAAGASAFGGGAGAGAAAASKGATAAAASSKAGKTVGGDASIQTATTTSDGTPGAGSPASQSAATGSSSSTSGIGSVITSEVEDAGTNYSQPSEPTQSTPKITPPQAMPASPESQASKPNPAPTGTPTSQPTSAAPQATQTQSQSQTSAETPTAPPVAEKPGLLHMREPKVKFPPMPPGHGEK